MAVETIQSSELSNELRQSIFLMRERESEGQSELVFSSKIQRMYDGGMHSALQQFSFLQPWGSLIPPTEQELQRLWHQAEPRLQGGLAIYPSLTGCPSDIYLSLEHEKALRAQVDKTIPSASHVVLLGAIGIRSIAETATWLKEKGFRGKLTAYDIQPIPLQIARIYKEFGLLPKELEIDFVEQDVLTIDKGNVDIFIDDVLGYYLTPEQYQALGKMVSHNLKHGGLWIARELVEPNGAPKPVDRNACGKKESDPSDPLNKFVKHVFGVTLPQAVIDEFEQTKWIKTPTYSRKSIADYQIDVPNNLRPVGTITVTSDKLFNSENPRIFNTFVYQK